jgi:hypothetical protein
VSHWAGATGRKLFHQGSEIGLSRSTERLTSLSSAPCDDTRDIWTGRASHFFGDSRAREKILISDRPLY